MMFYKLNKILCLIVGLCLSYTMMAQEANLGRLPIKNYPKSIYQAGTQTWEVGQDQDGILYFANNDGLLRFDGTHWSKYPIANNTIVRSLALDQSGRIYVGGQGEIGYFEANEAGHLVYISLMDKIPEAYHNLADVWSIEIVEETVFFQTSVYVIKLDQEEQVTVIPAKGGFSFLGKVNDQVYLQEVERGLLVFDKISNGFRPVLETPFVVTAMLPSDEFGILIVSLRQGLFAFDGKEATPWETSYDDFFAEKRIYCASVLPDQQIAVGTYLGGLVILDSVGQAVRHINKSSGLQNATVVSLFKDQSSNLWCGLDNGIDYVEVQSALTTLYPDAPLEGTGYDIAISDGYLYLATSTGLYVNEWKTRYTPEEQLNFKAVEGTAGQCWGLSNVNGNILLGHHEGTFQLEGENARKIIGGDGSWRMIPFGEDLAIEGHYKGLRLLKNKDGAWERSGDFKNFKESCRVLCNNSSNDFWMTHPYRGVFKITPSLSGKTVDVKPYTSEKGLPENLLNIYVFDVNGQSLFATMSGVYLYDANEDYFYPDTLFNNVLGEDSWVKFLTGDEEGNIWFVTENESGYLAITDKGLSKEVNKFTISGINNKLVGGFERIYPHDKENIFLGSEKGFLHFNSSRFAKLKKPDIGVLLNKVEVISVKDSIVAGSYFLNQTERKENTDMIFPPHESAYRFSFSAPWYAGDNPVQYRHRLVGFEKAWSPWSEKAENEYTNLSAGDYVFEVEAQKDGVVLDKKLSFPFEIESPWYATTLAKIIYVLILLGIFGGAFLAQNKKYKAVTAELKSEFEETVGLQQVKVQQTEAELAQLRTESLETELQFRQKELATNAMHLMQKGELLSSIKDALQKAIKKDQPNKELKSEVNKIINMMEQDALLDESWEQFIFHFNQVHAGFFTKLRAQFPNLTSYDQKMSAYLRMNLTTKEIASLLNISVRGVEGGRYRLRKKLGLDANTNLVTFIQEI